MYMNIYMYLQIHIYILYIYIYINSYKRVSIPNSARHAPRRKSQKSEMAKRDQWRIWRFLRCRNYWNHERLKLVEMPLKWHERICAQLCEWTHEPINRRTNEAMKHHRICESLIHWRNEPVNHWVDESAHQRINAATMKQWIMNQWVNDSANQWIRPMNHRINNQ